MFISHAELLAIHKAIMYIKEKNISNRDIVIASDSLGSIQKLQKPGFKNNPPLIYEIIEAANSLEVSKNININVVWAKVHAGDPYFDADYCVKKATKDGIIINVIYKSEEYLSNSKIIARENWQNHLSCISQQKGEHFYKIKNTISKKPWVCYHNLPRFATTKICRLRFNHATCPSHLKKFNITNTDVHLL